MGMTLFSNTISAAGWASALHGLKGWLRASKSQALNHTQATAASDRALQAPARNSTARTVATRSVCAPARSSRPSTQPFAHGPATRTTQRPLRVVRVVDTASAAANAGRMVISGRMADVCAELDRLAAMESNLPSAWRNKAPEVMA